MAPRTARWVVAGAVSALAVAMLVVLTVPSVRSVVSRVIDPPQEATREPGQVATREDAPTATDSPAAAAEPETSKPRFPAGVSDDGRYFVDGAGEPWFGRGDTAWSLMAEPTLDETLAYLDDRADRGFTLVLANVLEHRYATDPPANAAGDLPFVGTDFQSPPDEPYWSHVDAVVEAAAQRGITLLLVPAYLGYEGSEDGFDTEVVAAQAEDLAAYGRFLADRYGSATNIMWLIGHDQRPDDAEKERQEALASELPDAQLVGIGSAPETLGAQDWQPTSIDVDFETVYTYSDDPAWTADAWALEPPRPVIFLEGRYEQEADAQVGDEQLRRQQYGPFMAGASAVLFGNNPIWNFEANPLYPYQGSWQENLASAGSVDASLFGQFVTSHPWWTLQPDTTGAFLTEGVGAGPDTATARFSDALGLVYLPGERTATLDLSVFDAGAVSVDLVDPTSLEVEQVGEWSSDRSVDVATPGSNSAGDDDWLLVVKPV